MTDADAHEAPQEPVTAPPERRTLRWLLLGQVVLAVLLIVIDLGPNLAGMFTPSSAPELTQPTRPGDQTRRFRPNTPNLPSVSPDMPRRLVATAVGDGDRSGLLIRGGIMPGDGSRLVDALRAAAPDFVRLDSPGGSVQDALEIGRVVRELDVETQITAGSVCLSACPYIFVGGIVRSVDGDGRFGVHQHSFGERTVLPAFLAVDDIQRGQAEVLAHLDAMGIDLRIMGPAMATPADEIYILTPEELSDWSVVTASD